MTRLLDARRPVVLVVLAGAALVLLAEGRPWVGGRVVDGLVGSSEVTVPGSGAAPGLLAVALVVAAGAVVVATAAARIARLAGAVLLLAGLTVLALAGTVLRDPAGALRAHAVRAGTLTEPQVSQARSSAWVWLAVTGGVLICLAAGVVLARAGRWRATGSRYERQDVVPERPLPAAGQAAPQGEQRVDGAPMWDSLSRGEDPTE